MKKLNQLLILGTTLLLSAAALTGCSGSSAMGATIPQTTSGEPAAPQTDAGIIASETTGSNNRLNEILERGYIEIATEPYFAPNEFIDPTKSGEEAYTGSDVELAKYIGEALGVEVRLKPMDFTSVLGSITTGKYDLAISALAYTPARAETMNLSKGYYFGDEDPQTAYGILVRKEDVDSIKSFNDLSDRQGGRCPEWFPSGAVRTGADPGLQKIQPCFLHKRWFPDGPDRQSRCHGRCSQNGKIISGIQPGQQSCDRPEPVFQS